MTTQNPNTLPFDPWHEDGLVFEDHPELFVDLSTNPIIFSIRGIGYFSPRFSHVGVAMADLHTSAEFQHAHARWLDVEFSLLQESIGLKAGASRSPNEHQVLQAVLEGDLDRAEQVVARLEHRKRAGLTLVASNRDPDLANGKST